MQLRGQGGAMKERQRKNPIGYPFYPGSGESTAAIFAQAEQKESTSIMQRLLNDRIIFLNGQVDGNAVNYLVPCMFHLESLDRDADILLYVNSPGGNISDGMAIFDAMEYIHCDVATVCMGLAASMGAFLLACGAPGKRIALPHSEIMIHQPLAQFPYKQATDLEIHTRHLVRIKETLNQILAERTGQDIGRIKQDVERDYFMTAEEAKEYGIVDEVIRKRP
jgi:ATP-dependent Clp protease protease subunit